MASRTVHDVLMSVYIAQTNLILCIKMNEGEKRSNFQLYIGIHHFGTISSMNNVECFRFCLFQLTFAIYFREILECWGECFLFLYYCSFFSFIFLLQAKSIQTQFSILWIIQQNEEIFSKRMHAYSTFYTNFIMYLLAFVYSW